LDLKQELLNRALRLAQDPRVSKAMQNPTVVQGLVGAMHLRAKMQHNLEVGVQRMAKRFNLASDAEVRELRRKVSRLERELEDHKVSAASANGNGKRESAG
jgi:hypothetical protein